MTEVPTFDLSALARQAADQHLAVITAYNETAVTAEKSDKPKLSDLIAVAREAANRTENPDKDALKLVNAHEKALTAANLARRELAKFGAGLKGIEFDDVAAEPDDEEKAKATESRKQLMGILRIAAQTENGAAWANDYEVPNVGREGSTTISAEGTKRHRVTITAAKDGKTTEFASFSALALAKKSEKPSVDVDVLRTSFEKAGADKPFRTEVDGWTVTVTPNKA